MFPGPYGVPLAPPGAGQESHERRSERAASSLLFVGGFLLVAAALAAIWLTAVADVETAQGNRDTAADASTWRDIIVAGGVLLASPFVAAGLGLMYNQAWARPLGIACGILAQGVLVVGHIPGIIALVSLARRRK